MSCPSSPPVRSSIATPSAAAASLELAHAVRQVGDVGHEVACARAGWPPRSSVPSRAARRSSSTLSSEGGRTVVQPVQGVEVELGTPRVHLAVRFGR